MARKRARQTPEQKAQKNRERINLRRRANVLAEANAAQQQAEAQEQHRDRDREQRRQARSILLQDAVEASYQNALELVQQNQDAARDRRILSVEIVSNEEDVDDSTSSNDSSSDSDDSFSDDNNCDDISNGDNCSSSSDNDSSSGNEGGIRDNSDHSTNANDPLRPALKAILTEIGDGNFEHANTPIHCHKDIQVASKAFLDHVYKMNYFHCGSCHERGPHVKQRGSTTECCVCFTSRTKEHSGIRHFGVENDMNPLPRPIPENLPKLTPIEEQLIACVHTAFKCYRLPGGQSAYRGSVVNLECETIAFLNALPPRVEDLPAAIMVRKSHQVNQHNIQMLQAQGNPIAKVEAFNSTTKGKSLSPDQFNSLQNKLYLAKGALVLLTTNMWPEGGLANGSTGTVVDIEYDAGTPAPGLPKCVWVDFGSDYTGPTFFPEDPDHCTKRGWVPIAPTTAKAFTRDGNKADWVTHERRMLPLRLAWSWTVWKAQGQTIHGKVVINLGSKEKEHGLAYVAFSRATRFSSIGIIGGLAGERLTTQISQQKKLKLRVVEDQRLERLAQQTMRFLEEKRQNTSPAIVDTSDNDQECF
jgi:hypothetical protein